MPTIPDPGCAMPLAAGTVITSSTLLAAQADWRGLALIAGAAAVLLAIATVLAVLRVVSRRDAAIHHDDVDLDRWATGRPSPADDDVGHGLAALARETSSVPDDRIADAVLARWTATRRSQP